MKATIYARVSTADQSNLMQLDAIREYIYSRGWTIVAEFQEVSSGAKDDRPKRREIMKLASQRKIDVIVVWKLDRWGRSMRDFPR